MKKRLLILFTLITLSSCDVDKSFEEEISIDKDDVNIIDKVGEQGLDKAIKMYNTRSYAS